MLATRLAPPHYVLLTVEGRRTGRRYSTPVRPVVYGGDRWLVAPYGDVGWVRNARAAGQVTLTRRGRDEVVRVVECDGGESGPVLREYVRVVPATRPYFDAGPDDPAEVFAAEASHHPVFRVAGLVGPPR
jgi:deazaflavin-dependent oxidoreductase (nitroreductase family)